MERISTEVDEALGEFTNDGTGLTELGQLAFLSFVEMLSRHPSFNLKMSEDEREGLFQLAQAKPACVCICVCGCICIQYLSQTMCVCAMCYCCVLQGAFAMYSMSDTDLIPI